MRTIIKKAVKITVIFALCVTLMAQMSTAYSSEFTVKEKVTDFMSHVIGLDLTKYALQNPSSGSVTYPTQFNGLVAQENPGYSFEYNGQKLDTMSIFYNGYLSSFKIYSTGDYLYSKSAPTDILNQANDILKKYQTFVSQKYGTDDSSYLVPMQNILSSLNDLSPQNITQGNINFQVSKNGDKTRIQWLYSENGISTNWKKLELSFIKNNFLSFIDSWIIYKVSNFSAISSEEAMEIALDAAQNYEFQIGHQENGAETTETVKAPDLSNARYDVTFTIVPYRNSTSPLYHPSKLARDPLTLYPYWQFVFYLNESIAGNVGIQVSLWGDTKEIVYCHGYGFLGLPDSTQSGQDSGQPSDNQTSEAQPDFLNTPILTIAISFAAVLAISTSIIALRHIKHKKQ